MVSLDKTPQSIQYGRIRARINGELRKNSLVALALEFQEQTYQADVRRFNARKARVLAGA
ncbi:hypothetical protein [Streptomyces sp. NRRL F-5123]|uniref:hypothetical protein n=1 Tax=Streptomyces sp. NRRL F-5123 TaxID=1463856 RepID=UPI0005BBF943|nr:hypothetical protein [Streptomyces sp. NRRL F-5123]